MKRIKENKTIVIYRTVNWARRLGIFLMSSSIASFFFFLTPFLGAKMARQKARGFKPLIEKKLERVIRIERSSVSALEGKTIEPSPSPKPEIKNFYLTIEKIGLIGAQVIPDVDPGNDHEYKHYLKYGLVHAKTTAFPGQGKMVYVFGHSTDYPWNISKINALFYQIEKLENNDQIKIEYNGRHYLYYVFDKKIVVPDQVNLIEKEVDKDILVLQSCYPPGTTWKRVLLFARPNKFRALMN